MNTPRRARNKHHPAPNTPAFDITGMVYGGYGVSQHRGKPLYLPYTIEGEQVEARLLPPQKNAQFAEGVKLLRASADRVYPECDHFGTCWGCQWQHIAYPAQLLIKHDVVADQLQRHGHFSDAVLEAALQPVIPSAAQWRYNHQATFHRLPNGTFGFHRRDEQLTPIDYCWTLRPELQDLYEALDIDFANLRSFTLHLGSDGATMALLHLTNEDLPELEADLPTSVNVLLPDREPLNLVGESLMRYEVKGRTLRATAGAFFRAHVAQVGALVDEALFGLGLRGNEQVLDLYAGVGTFSAFIAPHCEVVTLVESYPPAATDADENLAEFDNVDVVEGSVLEVLEAMREDEAHYDAVVLDPPARGVGAEELAALIALQPARIVYVSSNPSTLGRDGHTLAQAGYHLARVQPIDIAPQTSYAELVATFTR
jgi:23S rRNA (uracil1939-C5)-methyltransferase